MSRLYALALRLLPRDVRAAHAAEMADVFAQLVRERRRRHGRRGAMAAAASELAALVQFAWHTRRGTRPPPRIDERSLAWPAQPERSLPMRATLLQDLRYGIRLLLGTPGVTLACVLTMAVAIGATTAVFSVVHGVLLKPLPFHDGERLVVLAHRADGGVATTTPGHFYDWQAGLTAVERIAGFASTQRVVERGDFAERTLGAVSVGSVFEVVGRTALEGRALVAADDDPAAPAVIVLANGFARRLFGAASPIGEPLRLGGTPFTIVGVMPPDFAFPDFDTQYWVPARFDAQFRQNRDQYFLLALARLGPDVTREQGDAQLNTVMDAIRRDHPQSTQSATGVVVPFKEFLVDNVETRLWVLLGGVLLVLLIACANIANLLLARGAARRLEMAVRHALGARSTRLVRQMLSESMLLAFIGGVAGVALGWGLLQLLVAWLPDTLPRLEGVSLDGTVLAFTVGASFACGLAFGLWPAVQLSIDRSAEALRHGARGTGHGNAMRASLVVTQVALSLTLLAGAGLLARSFDNLSRVRPGFEPAGMLTFTVSLPGAVYREPAQRVAYFERAVDRLRALPGVSGVALSTTLPVAGRGVGAWFNMLDRPVAADQTPPSVPYRAVTPDYFSTLGIPLRRGRLFTQSDGGPSGARTVVISEAVERRFWPGESAIGKRIYLGAPNNRLFPDAEIVGIVGDVKQTGLDEMVSEAVYVPHRLMPWMSTFTFAVRTTLDPAMTAGAARAALSEIDAAVPLHQARSMDAIVAASLAPARSALSLIGLFAVIALVLATIGVFGVLSYTVQQRRPEIAIRVALGATSRSVLLLVLQQGMRQVAIGIGIGLLMCVALSQYIRGLLFNVTPADPLTLLAVAALLAGVGLVAVYLPARRVMTVDPIAVLRES